MTDNTETHPELSALDKRIAKAAQLKAKYEQEMQLIKATKRAEENGQKIISGALLLNAVRDNPRIREWYLKEVADKVTRPNDLKRLEPLLEELRKMAAPVLPATIPPSASILADRKETLGNITLQNTVIEMENDARR